MTDNTAPAAASPSMRWMARTQALAWALGITLLVLVIAVFSALYGLNEAGQSRSLIEKSQNLQATFYDLRDFFPRNERAEITAIKAGDWDLTTTLVSTRTDFALLVERARRGATANAGYAERLDKIEELSRAKFANMQNAIDMLPTAGAPAAVEIIRTDNNRNRSTQIGALVSELLADEERAMQTHQLRYKQEGRYLTGAIILSTAAALIAAALSAILIRRQFVRLAEDKTAVERLNVELEMRVGERTSELEVARRLAESEARRATREQERVELLLRDLNHRVGNNLAMVSALISLQLARVRDPQARAALDSARQRVATIAQAQRRLRLSEDLESTQIDEVFAVVVSDTWESLASAGRIRIDTQFEPLVVSARDAVSLSVILNELIANAVKHAFPGDRSGLIKVSFAIDNGVPMLTVADNGIGTPSVETNATGLGATIVDRLSQQHGGEVLRASNKPSGTVVHVRLPKLRAQTGLESEFGSYGAAI